jgi:hypothetical protein
LRIVSAATFGSVAIFWSRFEWIERAATAMKYRQFGNAKRDVSIIGQGTWYIDESDRADAIAALRRGLDLSQASRLEIKPKRSVERCRLRRRALNGYL